jgi:hypothetical protein
VGERESTASITRTTVSCMAMGKRKRNRQPSMWVTTTDLPTAASHPFSARLNQLLREHGFDDFAWIGRRGWLDFTRAARCGVKTRPARSSASSCSILRCEPSLKRQPTLTKAMRASSASTGTTRHTGRSRSARPVLCSELVGPQ